MKLVISSDWHTDRSTLGVPRYRDIADAAWQTVDVAKSEKADAWAFLGDLCDPDDGPAALQGVALAIEIASDLARAHIMNFWLSGNHCVMGNGSGKTVLSPLRSLRLPEVMVFERAETFEFQGVSVAVLPYVDVGMREGDEHAGIREMYERNPAKGLVLGHATYLPGITPGEETNEMPRGRAVPFPFEWTRPDWTLLNGHWHEGQTYEMEISGGGPRQLLIPGSLARLTFGEAHTPRFLVLEI